MVWMKVAAALVAVLVLGVITAVGLGNWLWYKATADLDASLVAVESDVVSLHELPTPVAAYLARAIPAGTKGLRTARLRQEGEFQMGDGPEGWKPFTATEVFAATSPAFYWDAKIAMAPFTTVRIRDSYLAGDAAMLGKIAGVITVVDASGDDGLIEGALARYLAEAVWLPTRLATGPGLTWAAVDAHSAEARLSDRGVTVALRFTFNDEGDPIEVYGLRKREQDGEYIETPWRGRFEAHRQVDGLRIPTYGEVAWIIDGVKKPYWRGTIISVEYTWEP